MNSDLNRPRLTSYETILRETSCSCFSGSPWKRIVFFTLVLGILAVGFLAWRLIDVTEIQGRNEPHFYLELVLVLVLTLAALFLLFFSFILWNHRCNAARLAARFKQANLELEFELAERQTLEKILMHMEAQTRAILETAAEGIITINKEGLILSLNTAAETIFGYPAGEALGRNVSVLMTIPWKNEHDGYLHRYLKTNVTHWMGRVNETVGCRRDGSTFPMEIAVSEALYGEDRVFVGIIRDISERKRTEMARLESEKRYRLLFEDSPAALWEADFTAVKKRIDALRVSGVSNWTEYFDQNPEAVAEIAELTHIIDVNQAAIKLYQAEGKEDLKKGFKLILKMETYELFRNGLIGLAEKGAFCGEGPRRTLKRSQIYVQMRWTIASGRENDWGSVLVSIMDITEQKRAEGELRKLSRAVEQSASMVIITDVQGVIEYVNPRLCQVTGYVSEEILGKNPRILRSGKMLNTLYDTIWEALSAGNEWRGELHNRKKNGELYWVSASISPIRNDRGMVTHFLSVQEDITERKASEEQIHYLAIHDVLTGLYNRRHFFEVLTHLTAEAKRHGNPLCLAMCDLDKFKGVNDTYGHQAGDEVLSAFGKLVQKELRAEDVAGRYGGDEFILAFPSTNAAHALESCERIRKTFAAREFISVRGERFSLSSTMGLVNFDPAMTDKVFVETADQALYQAKQKGRNRVAIFEVEKETPEE